MRTILIILLLSSITAGQFSALSLVMVRRHQGRRRAEQLRSGPDKDQEKEKLTHLQVDANGIVYPADVPFIRVGTHDMVISEQMYDIVFEEQHGDTLHLWVHWDSKEQIALAGLSQSAGPRHHLSLPGRVHGWFKNLHLLSYVLPSIGPRPLYAAHLRYPVAILQGPTDPFDEVPHGPPRA